MKQYAGEVEYAYVEKLPIFKAFHVHSNVPEALTSQIVEFEIRPQRINWDEEAVMTLCIGIKDFKSGRTYRSSTNVALDDLKKYIKEAEEYWAKRKDKE